MKQALQLILNKLFKPASIIIFTVSLSVLCWFIPANEYSEAFAHPEPLTVTNVLFLIAWYADVIGVVALCFFLGRKIILPASLNKLIPLDAPDVYRGYAYIGTIGFLAAAYKIFASYGVAALFVTLFVEFQGNAVQDSVYEEYSVGIISLRYILIISFGIALFRLQTKKEYTFFNFFNVFIFLLYTLLLGRRIQILTSFFVYIALANRHKNMLKRVNMRVAFISVLMVLGLIVLASTLRNYGTYSDRGASNPLVATLANIQEYLASPFQAGLEIGNNLYKATHGVDYLEFTSIDVSLNTNSALSTIIYDFGWAAFIYAPIVFGFFAFFAGILYKNNNSYLFVAYPIILYGFAEIWRLNEFVTGLFKTQFIISLAVPLTLYFFRRLATNNTSN